MVMRLAWQADRALQIVCIGAHCDDIEIGCGGSLVALSQAYPLSHFHCWVFSGNAARAAESRACLTQLLDAERFTLQVFDHRDGYFPAQWAQVKERLATLSQTINADLVFTHTARESHQDHRVLAELTWNHFRRHTVLEYEIAKYEGDLGRANFYIPLSTEQFEAKLSALLSAFPSQASKGWFTRNTFEAIARLRGVESHATSGYAEAFRARKSVLDLSAQA